MDKKKNDDLLKALRGKISTENEEDVRELKYTAPDEEGNPTFSKYSGYDVLEKVKK